MNKYELELLEQQREYKVVKSNKLVLNSRYQYSLAQQKMIAYICSLIKPIDLLDPLQESYQLEYEFEILNYIRLMGIEKTGDAYNDIKATLKSLVQQVMWIQLPNGSETTVNWVNKATTNKRTGKAKFRIDEDLAPYLFALQSQYLSYGLINILNFKSKYGLRLYEILKAKYDMLRSVSNRQRYETPELEWVVELDELKRLLMLDGEYHRYPDFRIYVLETAQRDINGLSDMLFEFEPITKGRKTVKIKFKIQMKDCMERLEVEAENDKLLNKGMK